ncbi:MAG: GntR family transcriptional regulator [Paracoccus sp. (in: a-proteobacteria)]|nr:GntR family transcriptional regulator [Paracoccus sp. (in: a-proteobacteria)]
MTIVMDAPRVTAQDIARELREEVLSGVLLPGQHLPEVAISKRFSVSRGPVRDALRMLADSGLASIVPNAGVSVRQIGYADAHSLYELREALESQAARLAARKAQPGALAAAASVLGQQAGKITAHPAGAYLTSGHDADFHVIVAHMTDNPLLLRLLTDELYPQLMLLRRQHQHVKGRGKIALIEHRRILDAIGDGDEQIADLQMRRHIRNSWRSLAPQIAADLKGADT